jgi:hypothetical protein
VKMVTIVTKLGAYTQLFHIVISVLAGGNRNALQFRALDKVNPSIIWKVMQGIAAPPNVFVEFTFLVAEP